MIYYINEIFRRYIVGKFSFLRLKSAVLTYAKKTPVLRRSITFSAQDSFVALFIGAFS